MEVKPIPQNIEAEQNVLSAMMIDAKAVDTVAEMLKPEDFYRVSHQIVYRTMLALRAKGQPVDLVTVVEELKRANKLDEVGGVSFITLLANIAPTAANVKWHAFIVADKAVRRQMAAGGAEIAAMACEENGEDTQTLLDKMEQRVLRIATRSNDKGFVALHDAVSANMDNISRQLEHNETVTGLSTGFPQLDYMTGGLHPSDFIILAARPSMGKTSLGLNITENVAIRGAKNGAAPKRVALFSLEMSCDQLVQRMLRTEADVDAEELRPHLPSSSLVASGRQEEVTDVLDRLWTASDKLAGASVFIDDTPGLTLQELRSKTRKLKAEGGLDLVVIDYLQLMRGTAQQGGFENRQHEVSAISRGLKALARELNVPVLALSQLSRSVETRQEKRPMLSDLRESGSLEQDADIVMFLYREDYYKNTGDETIHPTELIIAKHRNGPTGKIDLFFKSDCTKFIGLDEEKAV
jgi:replicative DNA helicase